MLFLPVDLFSPYIKGRESAIDQNWNDLNQSNKVERGWLDNDNHQLRNWFTQDTYNDRLVSSNARGRIDQNRATGTDLSTQIALLGQPGALAQTKGASDYQVASYQATAPNINLFAGNEAATKLANSMGQTASAQTSADYQIALRNQLQQYLDGIAKNNALFSAGQAEDKGAQGRVALDLANDIRRETADNKLAAAKYQGQLIDKNAALLPRQQDVEETNLRLQQSINELLQKNPQLFVPQPQPQMYLSPETPLPGSGPTPVMPTTAPSTLVNTPNMPVAGQTITPPSTPPLVPQSNINDIYIYSQASNIPRGQVKEIIVGTGPDKQKIQAGMDDNGRLYAIENGQKRYINPLIPPVAPNNSIFSFEGMK